MRKRTFLTAILATAFAVCLTLGVTACGDRKEKKPEPAETQYTVQFSLGEGVTGTGPAAQTVVSGGKVTKPTPDPTRTDFEFDGWYNGTTEWDFAEDTVSGNLTLTAHWREYFDVTFDLAGGTAADGADYTAKRVLDGDTVTLPAAPTPAEGKEFHAWQIGDGETYGDPEDEVPIADDTTITAVYNSIQIDINYYDFDGTVFKTDTVDYGAPYTITTDKPAEKYTKFVSWDAENIQSVKSETSIYGNWQYKQSDDKYFEFTEAQNGEAYTVAEAIEPESMGGGTLYLPIIHGGKPVIGITAGTATIVDMKTGTTPLGIHTVSSVDGAAFATIDAATVVIPDAYTEVADYAFANNAHITTVKYERTEGSLFENNHITKIGDGAFWNVSNLATFFTETAKTIFIPNTITEIGDFAFGFGGGATGNNATGGGDTLTAARNLTFEADSTLQTIGEGAFKFNGFGSDIDGDDNYSGITMTFPASIVTIGKQAFMGVRYFTTLNFASGSKLTTIDDFAFATSTETGKNNEGLVKNVTIPKTVTKIGYRSFYRQLLASLTFEKGGTADLTIGNQAFYQQSNPVQEITSVEFPARLVSIGEIDGGGTFNEFDNLKTITFENTAENPSRLTTIGANCFNKNVALEGITIPKSVTAIGNSAFMGTTKLATLTFEKGGTEPLTIGDLAFQGTAVSKDVKNSPLTSVEIPARTTSIGRAVFADRYLLNSITFEETPVEQAEIPLTFANGALSAFTSDKALTPKATSGSGFNYNPITSIKIPKRTVSIGKYLVQGQVMLETLEFEEGIKTTEIPDYVAYCAFNLQTLKIPEGITSIGQNAFSIGAASTIIYAKVNGEEGNLSISKETVTFGENTKMTSLTLPSTLRSIGQYAFRNLSALATLTFADKTDGTATLEIGANNFDFYSKKYGAADLEVTIGSSVKSIGSAFCQNSKLKSVTIKEGLQSIGANAFSTTAAGSTLSEVTLPASLTSMDSTAFIAPKFATFKVASGNTVYESEGGDNGILYKKAEAQGNRTLYEVPAANETTTYNLTNVIIGKAAFKGNTHMTTLTLGTGVTLDDQAFMNCTALQTLTINAQPTYVQGAGETFKGCTMLETVTATNITSLCDNMFYGCTALVTFSALENITDFGGTTGFVFSGCSHLAWNVPEDSDGLTINAAVTILPEETFKGCAALTKININKVSELGKNSLNGTGIMEINTSKVTKFGANCLQATKIVTIDISAAETLGGSVFNNCKQLASVTVPAAVQSIESSTFAGCTSLTTITLEGTTLKTLVNKNAIPSANANLKVIVPDNLVAGYREATNWSDTTIVKKIVGTSTVQITFNATAEGVPVDATVTMPEAVTVNMNQYYTLPAAPGTTTGLEKYIFLGWKVDGKGDPVAAGTEIEITKAIQLTAVYAKKVTVTFSWGQDVSGVTGAELPAQREVAAGSKLTDPNVSPTREGFTFKGWKEKDAEDYELWDFATSTVPEKGDTLELVAVWEADAPAA